MIFSPQKILDARVLVAGAGGLGSPASMALAYSGIRNIGIVDYDRVELSNLQRQILHTGSRVGDKKTDSAYKTLKRINSALHVTLHTERITASNVRSIVSAYEVVIDGVDNFPTRYLLNDACYFERIPMVEGGVLQFDGQVTTFIPGKTPCLRCLFPEPPGPGLVPSCGEAGILGPAAGIVGGIQAWETMKLLAGSDTLLAGKLLIINTLSMTIRVVRWPADPQCPLCGVNPTINKVEEIDYSC